MSSAHRLLCIAILASSCVHETGDVFVPDPDDETVDPADPPTDPDPGDPDELAPSDEALAAGPEVPTEDQAIAMKTRCPQRSRTLSPTGLTFAIHISKHDDDGWSAYEQLKSVRHLIRARDVFLIERKSAAVLALRNVFPCNAIHFIAFPDELAAAYDAEKLVDGITIDWETAVWSHSQQWTVDKLDGYAAKTHGKNLVAGIAPWWPASFDDAHIVRASNTNYELAQIQDDCAHRGARAFASSARGLVESFRGRGMGARDIGFEISVDSEPSADNHTSVDAAASCSRKAYGKGARAIYLYGNAKPHLDAYFKAVAKLGLR